MVAVKMGGMMPPMGGMPQPMNMMPPPMPVPPMGQQMMPPQPMPMQQGAAPVAPQARSNAGRRKRFGDSLESMLSSGRQPVASDQMAGMNVFTGQMPRRPMPRGQMMGGTAMQPPVRRMMGGGPVSVPRETDIYGQPHMLAYINPEEADLLQGLGGMGTPGPGGVPQYNWFTDFISNITGGGSSSSSGGSGRNNARTGSSNKTSTSSAAAGKQYADSMKAGGGGTNLSGSGSSAMADLVAAQQAQTQKDDNRSSSYFNDITPSDPLDPFGGAGPDITPTPTPTPPSEPAPPAFDISVSPGDDRPPSYFEDITTPSTPPNTGVVGGYDPIGGGSVDDVGIGTGSGVIGGYDPIGGGSSDDPFSPPAIGDPGDASNIDIFTTLPVTGGTGGGDTDTDTGVNLDPVYYDMFGNPYKTQAEAAAADAEYLRKQQAAADAEAERKRMEQFAQLEAQAAAEAEMGLGPSGGTGGPDDPLYVSDIFETPSNYEQAQAEAEMGLDPFGGIGDPVNEGLGGVSLDKKVKDGGDDDEEEKSFVDQFKDDLKEFIDTGKKDFEMALAAGLFGSRKTRFDKLIKAGYSAKEANDFLDRGEQGMKKMMDDQAKLSAQDGDDYKPTVGEVVDPCPAGMRLDPVAGISVPVEEEDDTEEDTDEEEDTSDDELSGVVTTPPTPTT